MERAAAWLFSFAGILVLAGGCSEKSEASGSGPAGQVLERSGAVLAEREGAADRPLVVGDPVYRDDTIKTGPEASVTILLGHNQARWSLAGGKARRVDRSAAWRAETGSASASAFDDEEALPTSSAGRHSEPQVGDTRATAPEPKAEAEAAETRVATDEPPRPVARPSRRRSTREPSERAKGSVEPPPPAGGVGLALGATPMPPMAVQAPAGMRAVLGPTRMSGGRKGAALPAPIAASLERASQVCAASAPQAGRVFLSFTIGKGGAVVRAKVAGPPALVAQVGACLRAAAAELSFPSGGKRRSWRVRQEIRFELP